MIHFMMSWHILRLKHCKGNAIMDKYCIEGWLIIHWRTIKLWFQVENKCWSMSCCKKGHHTLTGISIIEEVRKVTITQSHSATRDFKAQTQIQTFWYIFQMVDILTTESCMAEIKRIPQDWPWSQELELWGGRAVPWPWVDTWSDGGQLYKGCLQIR